jgi:hypothetical protein
MSELHSGQDVGENRGQVTGIENRGQFTGSDGRGSSRSDVHVNFGDNRDRHNASVEDRLRDLERYMFGDNRYGEPGMIRRQQQQLLVSQINMGMNVIIVLALAALLFTR